MLKKFRSLFFLILFHSTLTLHAEVILEKPVIDERIEMLSIAFRLAECDEYNSNMNAAYVGRIHTHFDAYAKHELIEYIRKIRRQGIGYDAVANMAVHISSAPDFEPLVDFNKKIPEERWGKGRALKFLKLLRKFYIDANCGAFFQQESVYYQEVVRRFMPVYDSLDLNWYTQFYGNEPKERFRIILAPGNGGGNYGPHVIHRDGLKEVFAVMGVWEFDSTGMPVFSHENYFPTLLHEFNHSFINPMLPKFEADLSRYCPALFKSVEMEMRNQAYGDWQVMFNESLVRAAVVRYMIDHQFSREFIDLEINDNFYLGFIWIQPLVDKLGEYSSNRQQYQQLEEFMPEIVKAFGSYKDQLDQLIAKYNDARPVITGIEEFNNGDQEVSDSIETITIHFDQEMLGYGYSINYGALGRKGFPEISNVTYSEDKRAVILKVKLEPKQAYELLLMGRGFRSVDKVPIKDYLIRFKTK